MRIQNYDDLIDFSSSSRKESRTIVLNLFNTAIESVDPYKIISDKLSFDSEKKNLVIKNTSLSVKRRNIWIIGAGKAVGRMTEALERVLSELKFQGIICVPEGVKKDLKLKKVQCLESSHPLPSEVNIQNTKKTLNLIEDIQPEDLVIVLISGGGSAIWTAPISPITIDDLIRLNAELINSGMSIQEINIIRKHVSLIKGGKFAEKIQAEILVLVMSDVIGDNLESIASGPFYPDSSTFNEAKTLLVQYKLWEKAIPSSVKLVIEQGMIGVVPETPKTNNKVFKHIKTHILGSNKLACNAVISEAEKMGIKGILLTDKLEGDARLIGHLLARIYCSFAEGFQEKLLIVSGGETTVEVQGAGVGGRNQEVAAAALEELLALPSYPDIEFLSAGTDGVDGNSRFAGALVDDLTIRNLKQRGLKLAEYQQENNLSHFFEKIGGSLILTGPTGTNVMDLQIALLNVSRSE